MLLDIHTHHLSQPYDTAIINGCMYGSPIPEEAVYISAGIHPWYLTEENLPLQQRWLIDKLEDPRTIALGESGLDKLCSTPFHIQEEAFSFTCKQAEQYHLPLIIHAVKSYNEIIAFKQKIHPTIPWIIHGFRGKKELAQSLVKQGLYLSFGAKYQPEALASVPSNTFLLETDESSIDIKTLYRQAADIRNVTAESLQGSLQKTINSLFFNL